jgi:hypothetical protein
MSFYVRGDFQLSVSKFYRLVTVASLLLSRKAATTLSWWSVSKLGTSKQLKRCFRQEYLPILAAMLVIR